MVFCSWVSMAVSPLPGLEPPFSLYFSPKLSAVNSKLKPKTENANFVYAMEDVLDVYQQPHDPLRPLICIDECSKQQVTKSGINLALSFVGTF